jgi:hypothetical protein
MADSMKDYAEAERLAPLETDAPLPLTTPTLAYIPPDRRVQYQRRMQGDFSLRFVSSDDEKSVMEHSDLIAKGKLPVLPPGHTPESRAKKASEMEAASQKVLDKVNKDEADTREAQRKAAYDREHAALRSKFGR